MSFHEGVICREFRIKPELYRIYDEIHYLSDTELHGVYDYWQYPEDTLSTGRGDCEDVAILLVKRIIDITGRPAWIVTGDGRELTHAWVYFDNRYYDPTFRRIVMMEKYHTEFTNIDYLNYNQALYRCSEDNAVY